MNTLPIHHWGKQMTYFSGKNHFFRTALHLLATLLLCSMVLPSLQSCSSSQEPLQLGFIGTLSGKHSDLGSDVLEGVRLAIEEANQKGGIKGRQIELVIKDDAGSGEQAILIAEELLDAGIRNIIGPNLSSVAMQLVPWCNNHGILLISPTVSTSKLAGLDDAMLRIMPHKGYHQAKYMAQFTRDKMGLTKGVILYDQTNKAYARDVVDHAEKALADQGVAVISHPFLPEKNFDYAAMIKKTVSPDTEFVYLVSSALDTAMFCWQLKKQQLTPTIFIRGWALTDELYRIGNEAVEGAILMSSGLPLVDSPILKEFQKKMQDRSSRKSEKFMVYGYEATLVVLKGLNGKSDDLKQNILSIKTFKGLQDTFTIDRFGDVERATFSTVIQNSTTVPFDPQAMPKK